MKIALYARVSTKQHGQDVETQLQALRAWAKQRKFTIVAEYADRGISGAKASRPELDRLMRDARHGKFEAVAVWRFDRFARSVKHLISGLEEFQALKIHFLSLTENVDTSTPMGKMVFTIMAALAEFLREIIRENVQIGVDRARREGKTLGRPRKAEVDEEAVCRQEAKVRQGKTTVKALSREWGLARSTIRAIWKRSHPPATEVRRRQARRKDEKGRGPRGGVSQIDSGQREAKDRRTAGRPKPVHDGARSRRRDG